MKKKEILRRIRSHEISAWGSLLPMSSDVGNLKSLIDLNVHDNDSLRNRLFEAADIIQDKLDKVQEHLSEVEKRVRIRIKKSHLLQ